MTINFLCELIEKNARIILPEFGAFLVKDDGSGIFKPENITFSPFLRYNDGLIEDALSKEKNINKDEAKKEILDFIEDIKSQLIDNKVYKLGDFGFLNLDHRGSIHFNQGTIPSSKPKTSTSTSTSPIEPKPKSKKVDKKPDDEVHVEKEEEVKTEDIELELLEIKENEEIEKQDELAQEKETENEKHQEPEKEKKTETPKKPTVSKSKTSVKQKLDKEIISKPVDENKPVLADRSSDDSTGIGKAILIGILIAFGFVIVAVGWFLIDRDHINLKRNRSEKVVIPIKPITIDKVKDDIESSAEKKGEFDDDFNKLSTEIDKAIVKDEPKIEAKKIAETEFPAEKPIEKQKIIISYPQDGMFHLVVGSFRNPEYADKYSDDLKSSGYNSRVIIQPSGMHAVTVGSFPTQKEALDAMDNVKAQHPNVWLLRQ
jgi:nucleoid DNA-binding protein